MYSLILSLAIVFNQYLQNGMTEFLKFSSGFWFLVLHPKNFSGTSREMPPDKADTANTLINV